MIEHIFGPNLHMEVSVLMYDLWFVSNLRCPILDQWYIILYNTPNCKWLSESLSYLNIEISSIYADHHRTVDMIAILHTHIIYATIILLLANLMNLEVSFYVKCIPSFSFSLITFIIWNEPLFTINKYLASDVDYLN